MRMTQQIKITKCFIASFMHPDQDLYLQKQGISNGLISFSIPNLGILFRCIGEGDMLSMEFSTFFSLLEFLQTKLKDEKINKIHVFSSNPRFVFSFSSYSNLLKAGTTYRQMLDSCLKKMSIQVGYVKPQNNQALSSTADYPSIPTDKIVDLAVSKDELSKIEFKPLQKGIKL